MNKQLGHLTNTNLVGRGEGEGRGGVWEMGDGRGGGGIGRVNVVTGGFLFQKKRYK